MRKFLSIALLLLLAFPLVAPAFGQTAEQHLLLCCRKGGAHHCMTVFPTDAPMMRTHCAAFPKAAAAGHASEWAVTPDRSYAQTDAIATLRIGQVEAGYRISFGRSRQMRGPPVSFLS